LEHRIGIRDCHVQIERLGGENLLPREREQLTRQARHPLYRLLDLRQVLAGGPPQVRIASGETGESAERMQLVVEIVRQAGRQPADGLHLRCLPQSGLAPLALRDVPLNRRCTDDDAASIAKGRNRE